MTSSKTYYDRDGKPSGVEGIFRDISRQKQAEEMRDRLAIVIEQASEFIMVTDAKGDILYVNPAFERETGYPKEEVIGENPRILKSGKHNKELYQKLWATITSGHVWKGRLWNKRKDGSVFQEDATIAPLKDTQGTIVNYVAVKRDVTKEVMLETQLFQAQKMESIGTLAGGIAHDFNNILTAILGYTEIGILDTSDEKVKKSLVKVHEAGNRAKDLVHQILTFSRQSEIEPRPVKIQHIVREALKLLRATLPSSVEIKENILSDSSTVADPTQLHQVVMNLCSNAGYAMEETGGILTIELLDTDLESEIIVPDGGETRNFIKLIVADTGVGMSEETADRVFDPFFTTKEKGQGTGMGLAVVHGIVNRYKGTINIETAVGKGTTISVLFPLSNEEYTGEIVAEEHLAVGNERILFIDDEEVQTEFSKDFLERLGYFVDTETNSEKALEKFRQDPQAYDIIITDMTMPKLSGDELSRQLLSIRPGIPIILCTGYSQKITEAKALSIGIKGYIRKPFVMKQMAKAIRKALES